MNWGFIGRLSSGGFGEGLCQGLGLFSAPSTDSSPRMEAAHDGDEVAG